MEKKKPTAKKTVAFVAWICLALPLIFGASPTLAQSGDGLVSCVEVTKDDPIRFGWPSPKGEWHHEKNRRYGDTWRHQGTSQILTPQRWEGGAWMAYVNSPGTSHGFGTANTPKDPTEISRFFECCPSKTLKVEVDTLGSSWGAFPSPRGDWQLDSSGTCWIHQDGKQAFAEWYGTWMWFLQDPENATKPCESFINVAVAPSRGGGDPREIEWRQAASGRLFTCK